MYRFQKTIPSLSMTFHQHANTRNKGHFQQAEGTPFTKEPKKSLLGNGSTKWCHQILQGVKPHHAQFTPIQNKYLKKLQKPSTIETIQPNITVQELQEGFKCWPEKQPLYPQENTLDISMQFSQKITCTISM